MEAISWDSPANEAILVNIRTGNTSSWFYHAASRELLILGMYEGNTTDSMNCVCSFPQTEHADYAVNFSHQQVGSIWEDRWICIVDLVVMFVSKLNLWAVQITTKRES